MSRRHELIYALNAGGVDPEAVARIDLEKLRMAGEHPVKNLLPRVLGPATLRPGSEMLAAIPGDAPTRGLRFWKDDGAAYILLLSASEMRVLYNGAIQQVPSVSTAINSGSWTDQSEVGATATGGATLSLSAASGATAKLRQAVTASAGDSVKAHVLRVVVSAGPVLLRMGTTAGSANLMATGDDISLGTGTHKISVTPGVTTFYVEVSAIDTVLRTVSSILFEPAGDLVLPTPWTTIGHITALRTWQSLDVIFCGNGISQQQRIEHRGPLSWSIVNYQSDDGPWVLGSDRITMTPTATGGNTTITASRSAFKAGHVGALLEITHVGRTIQVTLNAVDESTDYVTIVGVGTGRQFYVTSTGAAFVGTLVLERSFEPVDPSTWTAVYSYVDGAATFVESPINDEQDNITAHYRFRVTVYTSGSVDVKLAYDADVQRGRARITSWTSSTSVNVEVLEDFGRATASRQWRLGAWSTVEGWPRVPVIHDGRLHWFRGDQDFASVPDDYTNFNDTRIGDGAPFTRSVGLGGESEVRWATSAERLVAGSSRAEMVIAASEFDGPLTPTSYTVRRTSQRGSGDIDAVTHDDGLFFAQRSSQRLYELSMVARGNRYESTDVTRLNPIAYRGGIRRLAVQQHPDTRCYAALGNGNLSVLTWDRRDEVAAITTIDIAGATVEDVVTLPTDDQDDVYVLTLRGTKRYIERLAKEADQQSSDTCALLDGYKVLTGAVTQITGATHFANETVSVWADGLRLQDRTLNSLGVAGLGGNTYARVVYGKTYTASWKSVKLGYAGQLGTALGQTKKVAGAALLLVNSTLDGIRVGPDANNLDDLPAILSGSARTKNQFVTRYDQDIFPINSDWTTDSRVYIEIESAEGPKTIQGLVIDVETRDGAGGGT